MNKGTDRGVEFSRLQAQYLYTLAGGLLSVFLVFIILYMVGVNRWSYVLLETVSTSILVLAVFRLGRKYDPYGLIKLATVKYRPFHTINRECIISPSKRSSHEKHPEGNNIGK